MKNKFLVIFVLILCACTQNPSIEPMATALSSATINPEQELLLNNIQASFSAGLHAGKFSCEKCHTTEGETVVKHLAWTEEGVGQVESISTPTELCGKCHLYQTKGSGTQGVTQLAHSDFECTNCHNAHNLKAGCTDSTCHTDINTIISAQVAKPSFHTNLGDPNSYMCGGTACHELARKVAAQPPYHQPVHQNVPCYVCHDVSGMMVIMEDELSWITVLDSGQDNGAELLPQISHTIGLEVQCDKCHYTDNAWALQEILPDN